MALVWFDGTSLRVGYLQPGGAVSEHAVPEVNAHYLPLVPAGGRVYWVDPAGTFVPALGHWSQVVRYLDVATGTIGIAGAGQTVFLSADGRELFMSQTATTLTETPVTGPGAVRQLTLPRGWYLPGGDGLADLFSGAGLATANGIVVQSQPGPGPAGLVLALWNPARGQVTVIGRARGIIGAYTPPGARYSLLALGADIAWARWLPGGSSLIADATTGSGYLVDVATLAARPLAVRGRGAVEVNYTAAVVPLGHR